MATTPDIAAVGPFGPEGPEEEDLEDLGPLAVLSREERRRLRTIRHQTPSVDAVPAHPLDAVPAPSSRVHPAGAVPASTSTSRVSPVDAVPAPPSKVSSLDAASRPPPLSVLNGRVAGEVARLEAAGVPATPLGAAAATKRYRSGAPPVAPVLAATFAQAAQDPHLLRQWKRRVNAWELRAQHWLPREEMALVFLEALQSDAALLCQDVPLDRLQKADGIEHLFAQLAPLEQQKSLSFTAPMRAYEQIRRMPNELAKSYHARFLAVEAQLQRLGLT
eukprot:6467671-Amphidinium_carterae.1